MALAEPTVKRQTLRDLLAAYKQATEVGAEVKRKAQTGLAYVAAALRPHLAARGLDADSILDEIPVTGLLANHESTDEALEVIVTKTIREAIVVIGSPDEKSQRNRANTYSSAVRAMLRWALAHGWPLRDKADPGSAQTDPTSAGPNPQPRIRTKQEYRAYRSSHPSPVRALTADDFQEWHPRHWPEGPRGEVERWRACVQKGEEPVLADGLPGLPRLEETSIRAYEHAFARYFGGLRRLGLVDEASFTVERFYQLLLSREPWQEWVDMYLDRTRKVRGDDQYVPAAMVITLRLMGLFIKRWYYPRVAREQFEAWGRQVPPGAVVPNELYRAWKPHVTEGPGHAKPSPETIWEIAMRIWATAQHLQHRRERATAFKVAAMLIVNTFVPLRRANLAGATLGTNPQQANFCRLPDGWHVRFDANEYKADKTVAWLLHPRVNEYLDAYVNDPDKRQAALPIIDGKPQDRGYMFPSAKDGGPLAPETVTELIKEWTWRATDGKFSFSPHATRTGVASALAEEAIMALNSLEGTGAAAAIGAAVLGNDPRTVERFYQKQNQQLASRLAQSVTNRRLERYHGPGGEFEQRLSGLALLLRLSDEDAKFLRRHLSPNSTASDFARVLRTFPGIDDPALEVLWRLLYPSAPPLGLVLREPSARQGRAGRSARGNRSPDAAA